MLVGAGHGGVEAIIIGVIGVLTVVNMVVMRNADLSAMGIPADQLALANQQVAAFWDLPAYMGLLGLAERVFAICLHISLSVMVLYSVAYKKPVWFWLAMLWHALVDAVAVVSAAAHRRSGRGRRGGCDGNRQPRDFVWAEIKVRSAESASSPG